MILPTALSSLNLYQPLKVGNDPVEMGGDINWACWPSYVRQSLAMGGDHMAKFTFSASDEILERWFDDYLGCHFEETFAGVKVFEGLVWSMRLSYNGVVLTKSLDSLANSVRVAYKTGSAAAEAVTSPATDAASIARYGTKEYLEKLSDVYITSATAGVYATNLLAALKQIRATQEEARLLGESQPGTLQVEVRGYVHTLNWRTISDASTASVAADAAVSAALAGADFITAGQIAANPATVSEEADNMPVWDRIKAVAQLGGSTQRWLAGCHAGRVLNYQPADENTIAYEQEMRTRLRLTFLPDSGEIVPAPLVRPGGVALIRDLMAGRALSSNLLEDPRALFVEMVEYSQAGVVLKGQPGNGANKAAALAMALAARPVDPVKPIIEPIKPIRR